uniref:tRNA-specific adenosine deaminase 1 n=1 Tax=Neogobius melanostomus TaxID=47308 RepID=A0A8C6U0A6_9GOBI
MEAGEIASLCYERFQELPRTGKPEAGREWTLLAAVVQVNRSAHTDSVVKEVVSLGTGSKCIGQASMSPTGEVLNDSHAEVLARRGCIRYLMEELQQALSGRGSTVWERVPGAQEARFRLQPQVSFVLFTSHTPCGDASIIPMVQSQLLPCPAVSGSMKRKASEETESPSTKLPRTDPHPHRTEAESVQGGALDLHRTEAESVQGGALEPHRTEAESSEQGGAADVHRTGAKCVPGGPADPLLPGAGYHCTGLLRLKPGRGDRTLSLSCSDKLARWGVLGFQGALLSHYLQGAVYFTTVVVGKCPYSQEALQRAMFLRCSHVSGLPAGYSVTSPLLLRSSLEFPFSQAQTELRHQAAISWCKVSDQPLDITANGYKHGVTKKALGTAKARSLLCKRNLFESFLSVVAATPPAELPLSLRSSELRTYWDYKAASAQYQQAWALLRSQAFPLWPRSDRSLLLFSATGQCM